MFSRPAVETNVRPCGSILFFVSFPPCLKGLLYFLLQNNIVLMHVQNYSRALECRTINGRYQGAETFPSYQILIRVWPHREDCGLVWLFISWKQKNSPPTNTNLNPERQHSPFNHVKALSKGIWLLLNVKYRFYTQSRASRFEMNPEVKRAANECAQVSFSTLPNTRNLALQHSLWAVQLTEDTDRFIFWGVFLFCFHFQIWLSV